MRKGITRLLSLDVFRGLTIVIMVLVNSPGNSVAYSWLEHSTWDGCTLADLVFPFFIVIAGMSSVLALSTLKTKGFSTRQLLPVIFKRSLWLFGMGLLLNAFPHHFDFSTIRIPGVLQRIAVCYFFSAVLFLTTSRWVQGMVIVGLLAGYWLLISFAGESLPGYLDQKMLSSHHLYTPAFDPEGLLSTLPAIASALFGNFAAFCLMSSRTKQQQLRRLLVSGLILAIAGWLWSFVFPFNKSIWSSSYVLWTSGLAFILYSICFYLIEIWQWTRWSKPFCLFGRNAMLIYILHVLFLKIQAMILIEGADGQTMNLRRYITALLFGDFTPENASLCYGIAYTLLWYFVIKCIARWRPGSVNKNF